MTTPPDAAQPIPRVPSAPRHPPPPGACDTHAHVFGPVDRFPIAGSAPYLPPLAPFERYQQMLAAVGVTRGILVQPAFYGTDVRALMGALGTGHDWLRGIAAATSAISDTDLQAMHAAGVRGLRFIEMPDPRGGGRYAGAVGVDELRLLAPRMRALGWHAQIWAKAEDHAAFLPSLLSLGVPLVLDHMGSLAVERGVGDAAFQQIVRHLDDDEIWVKLSLCRNSQVFPDYPDLRPFHDALVAANPRQLLWGSDWPHVRMTETAPDVGHLLDLVFDWVGDEPTRQMILATNAQTLFGFDPHSALETPHARD